MCAAELAASSCRNQSRVNSFRRQSQEFQGKSTESSAYGELLSLPVRPGNLSFRAAICETFGGAVAVLLLSSFTLHRD